MDQVHRYSLAAIDAGVLLLIVSRGFMQRISVASGSARKKPKNPQEMFIRLAAWKCKQNRAGNRLVAMLRLRIRIGSTWRVENLGLTENGVLPGFVPPEVPTDSGRPRISST